MEKKIIFIINSLKKKGGSERVCCLLANLFAEKFNFEITILNREVDFEDVCFDLDKKVKVKRLGGNLFSFLSKLQSEIDNETPDYVLVHNMGNLSLLCSLLQKRNTKILSLEHTSYISRPFYKRMMSKILYHYDKVIVLVNKDLEYYKNSVKIPNISPYENRQGETFYDFNSHTIVSVGRLSYEKNFEALLEAWRLVLDKEILNWNLEIYGEGVQKEYLQNIIDKKNIRNVRLMGRTDTPEQVYQKASFFAMTSIFEGLPMVLIEAQSFGLPLISYNCPTGPAEIIKNNENGILVENQNIQKLSEAILELIKDKEKRILFSKNALNDVKKYSSNEILLKWKEVFN